MEKREVLIILLSIVLIGLIAVAVALFGTKKPEQQKNIVSENEKLLATFELGTKISGLSYRDGGPILFSAQSKGGNFSIFSIDNDNGSKTQITPNEKNEFDPSLSPSGDYMLFVSHNLFSLQNPTPAPYELWEMEMFGFGDNSRPRKILSDMKDKSTPAYSPDGKEIIFTAQEELWIVDRNGANQKPLLQADETIASVVKGVWSPDGEEIYVEFYNNGKYGLLKMPDNGESKKELIAPDLDIRDFSLSANGQKIAFIANGEIWAMNSDGNNQQQLTNGKKDISNLVWSPDGKKMAFARENEIWTIEVPPALVLESQKAKKITEWLTYTDSKYGYSIKYPNTWYLKKETIDSRDFVSIESTKKPLYGDTGVGPRDPDAVALDGYSVMVIVHNNDNNFSLTDYLKSIIPNDSHDDSGKPRSDYFVMKQTVINGLEAIEMHEENGWVAFSPDYFLAHDNYIYEIGCENLDRGLNGLQGIAEQIVQSFSFIK